MAKYRIGLDVGTNSIGWAVTDLENNLISKKGKKLLGVLMFEEQASGDSDPNKLRRTYRCQRRRLRRRKERLNYLNEIFAEEINKIDLTFFERLDESFLKLEDRSNKKDKYTLFIDKYFNDKTYFKKFKTIYHLQKYLMESNKKEDIRLIYLALRHLIKYRGNFLNPVNPENYSSEINIDDFVEQLNNAFEQFHTLDKFEKLDLPIIDSQIVKDLIVANKINKKISLRKESFIKIINKESEKKNALIEFVASLLAGSSVEIGKYIISEEPASVKISFADDILDKLSELKAEYSDSADFISNIEILFSMYQSLYINKFVSTDLPTAMIERFDRYGKDLKLLKLYIKTFHEDKYEEVFNSTTNLKSYAYLARHNYDKNTHTKEKLHRKKDDKVTLNRFVFIDYLKKEFQFNEESDIAKELLERINSDDFLLTQSDSSNGNLPYQLNYFVMKKIIDNQSKFYNFFLEKDKDGYVNKDKIMSLLTFKIPYYVGPLSLNYDEKDENNHAWIKRKTNNPIRPWNFNETVDLDASATEFIQRMQNKCTYLINEYCLPKDSIIFQKYLVYQQLNTLYVNGKFYFDNDAKEDLINNFYSKKRKITRKDLETYISNKLKIEAHITYKNGKDKEVDNNLFSLSSLYDFLKVFGSLDEVDKKSKIIEQIIRDIAIFEDKTILVSRLKNQYNLTDSQIKTIKSFNYSKFSRLSGKLLNEIHPIDKNGEVINETILSILKKYNGEKEAPATLNEILEGQNEYDFKTIIKKENESSDITVSIDQFIEDSYLPKISKRPTILSCRIIEELAIFLKCDVSQDFEFYIECARSNKNKKEKTITRFDNVQNKIKKSGIDSSVENLLKDLNELDPSTLNSEKYYLYFLQLGKDMYTGNPIEIKDLNDYDVDHIIPRSLIKNDSLENKVLTLKKFNNSKQDIYPLSNIDLWPQNGGRSAAIKFYKMLLKSQLISNRKYIALTATDTIDDSLLEGFANRQISTTNQSVIGLRDVLKDYYNVDENNIVFSKAENVSDFRQKYDLIKSRTANNFHHAHDAFLNIFVGSAVNERMRQLLKNWTINKTENPSFLNYIKNKHYTINPEKICEWYINNHKKQFDELKDVIYNYKFIFTKTRTYIGKGLFKKSTIYPANDGSNIPVKNNLPTAKYGGLLSYAFGFYVLLRTNDNETIIEPIPNVYSNNSKEYLDKTYKNGYEILLDKLKINTKIKINDCEFIIPGKNNDYLYQQNAIERFFPYKLIKIIKKIDNFISKLSFYKIKINVQKEKINEVVEKLNKCYINSNFNEVIIQKNNKGEVDTLNSDELNLLLEYLLNLFRTNIYQYKFSLTLNKNVNELKTKFNELHILLQIFTINELLSYLKTNERSSVNLSYVGFSTSSGVLNLNKNVKQKFKIIFESNTGLYKKEFIFN